MVAWLASWVIVGGRLISAGVAALPFRLDDRAPPEPHAGEEGALHHELMVQGRGDMGGDQQER
jgi:hypothetical protein